VDADSLLAPSLTADTFDPSSSQPRQWVSNTFLFRAAGAQEPWPVSSSRELLVERSPSKHPRSALCCATTCRACLGSLHALNPHIELLYTSSKRIEEAYDTWLGPFTMTSAFSSLLSQSRVSRSESTSKSAIMAVKELEGTGDTRIYPGSLHRHQRSNPAVPLYRSMLNVDSPSLQPIAVQKEESMEDWVSEKLSQTARKHITNDWADILCFYTATNGVPSVAPTRASPAPQPNGKAISPQEIPQSVSSTDPKIAAQQASDMRNIVRRKLTGYVGFANLPNQWHRKSVRKGFNFNVMVVGKLSFPCSFIPLSDNLQANLALENLRWLTLCSTLPSTHRGSAKDPVSTSSQKRFPSNLLARTLRRTAFVYV